VREYAALFARAFLQVSMVAVNVSQIAQGHYAGAFVVGGLISFFWFGNARTAGRSEVRGAAVVYTLGASCGTVAGMFLSRCLL
jgi:hypothetical protein